ncbi:expressed unknown protein [Seminavis robusta]|uniref:Uncharacterized protein n=1 Tax=Seminavis robusta TaxID=568900 RepID=A0A9N8EZW2_9STRA|nr:expressed unknown protein [Seminavis robusta]|eukprot:Sro2324_g323330.1 n/a (482) ;mRNA; f:1292-2825
MSMMRTPIQRFNLVLISAALLLSQQSLANALITHNTRSIRPLTTRTPTSTTPPSVGIITTRRYASLQPNPFDDKKKGSFWSPSEERSSPLKVRRRVRSAFQKFGRGSKLSSGESDTAEKTTWSRPGEKSSALGVRSRVKAVLKKAKSRTGIQNSSEEEPAGLWVAEVASIGGLSEESDLVIKARNGKANGKPVNGAAAAPNGSSKSNGVVVNHPSATSASKLRAAAVVDLEVHGKTSSSNSRGNSTVVDGLRADVPTVPPEPLPFTLPKLTPEQEAQLLAGERVQEQSKMGREGSGYVVMDVKAPPFIIWECLLDFENYPELIKTVRSMEMFTSNKLKSGYHAEKPVPAGTNRQIRHYGIPSVTRAAFCLSKFRLNIAAIHNYRPHPDGHYMVFNLDPECTNMVLQSAKGIWYTESHIDGRGEEYTRVWLLCSLKVSSLLPKFIVDYTAKRAMPRATNWLRPHIEPIAEMWAEEERKHEAK